MPLDQTNWKQDTETKLDVFSLEGLIAWLEKQPPEKEYDYMDCAGGCLIGQYLIARTGKSWEGGWGDVRKDFRDVASKWDIAYYRLYKKLAPDHHTGHTFGAALSRARVLLAETRK